MIDGIRIDRTGLCTCSKIENLMASSKSLDKTVSLIATLLCDVQKLHEVFTRRSLRLTLRKVEARIDSEGFGFLTKTLPRLGKALDRALSSEDALDCSGFHLIPGTKLPRFLGELFQQIFDKNGYCLPTPNVTSITSVRQVCYLFYKYELPYSTDQEHEVLESFRKVDHDLLKYNSGCASNSACRLPSVLCSAFACPRGQGDSDTYRILVQARSTLQRVFADFDVEDIYPRHGPGSVSTKETLHGKYQWSSISPRITETYPLDAYFYASLSHVCDSVGAIQKLQFREDSAKVVLVPKDSRGPRLISEEPLAFQWIQQGLGRAIVRHLERHPLTRDHVRFTDQTPNQHAAWVGSLDKVLYEDHVDGVLKHRCLMVGRYATLDLKEASDRITIGLVQLLFPEHVRNALMNCRSLSTRLPNGEVIKLSKFAPMGSALCFPVLATLVWAILDAAASDTDARECIYVYGDDVIVKTAEAENAIKHLEEFGLLVNRSKSCTRGFFRESCGMDAYRGANVTPVRFRTVWTSTRCPKAYDSWVAYANSMYDRSYFMTYDKIVSWLFEIYKEIPDDSMNPFKGFPSLRVVPEDYKPKKKRYHKDYQVLQWKVWNLKPTRLKYMTESLDGWSMLLRYFAECVGRPTEADEKVNPRRRRNLTEALADLTRPAFSVSSYTQRDSSLLEKSWR